ncbi:MAG: hypothetical protein U9N72_08460 [Bacteroidota bacterium]|nr:hypothetical protein [Bacteroidota bacterium]
MPAWYIAKAAGAQSIGLTLYPAYPDGSFENKGIGACRYQIKGDRTWFGARLCCLQS